MSGKPNILHLVTALSWRGGEQQVAYLIDQLKDKANQWVLCSEGSKMALHCQAHGISYVTQKKRSGFDLAYSKCLKNLCREKKIDLCHLHDAHAHSFAILAADLFLNQVPLVLSRRVDFPIKNKWTSKYKYNHPSIRKILCVSHAIQEITKKGIRDHSKLSTVYSGIDLQKFGKREGILRRDLGLKEDDFLIGNTSALADHKDYFTFLDTAEKVLEKNENLHFIIMGDGPMKKEIHDYAELKQHSNRIHFTGFRKDIPLVLPDLDLFFISSKTEGLGTSILDAFASNVPVVATAAGGIPELVVDQKTGLLLSVGDTTGLAKAIEALISNSELRMQLSQEAGKKVAEFSKENTAVQTWELYQEVLSNSV